MALSRVALALFMASALTPAAQAPQQRLNMSVSIATDAAEIEPGSAVVIQIAMKNDSKTPLEIGMSMPGVPEVLFGVSVTDERGRPAPATAFARKRPQYPLMGSGPRVRLGPDGSYRARLILTKRFDLTEPGQYIVVVWLKDAPTVRSNLLRITVDP